MTFFIDFKVSFFVFADKITSLYEMPPSHYKTLLNNNIRKVYLIADSTPNKTPTKNPKKLYKEVNLDGKMECYAKRLAFVTLKDHKENFKIYHKCPLMNLSKSEMGRVSKKYLENIISKLNIKFQYN